MLHCQEKNKELRWTPLGRDFGHFFVKPTIYSALAAPVISGTPHIHSDILMMTPIQQTRKRRSREVQALTQGHTARRLQGRD